MMDHLPCFRHLAPRAADQGFDRGWMLLFGDLLALLLSFFVLLYSMTSVPAGSWSALRASLSQEFHQPKADIAVMEDSGFETGDGDALGYVEALIEARRSENGLLGMAEVERLPDRVILRLFDKTLFGNKGLIRDDIAGDLTELAAAFARLDNPIAVLSYKADWTQALESAEAVAQILSKAGYGRPVEHIARIGPEAGYVDIVIRQGAMKGTGAE